MSRTLAVVCQRTGCDKPIPVSENARRPRIYCSLFCMNKAGRERWRAKEKARQSALVEEIKKDNPIAAAAELTRAPKKAKSVAACGRKQRQITIDAARAMVKVGRAVLATFGVPE